MENEYSLLQQKEENKNANNSEGKKENVVSKNDVDSNKAIANNSKEKDVAPTPMFKEKKHQDNKNENKKEEKPLDNKENNSEEKLEQPKINKNQEKKENNKEVKNDKKSNCLIIGIISFIILLIAIIIGFIYMKNLYKEEYIILDDEESETFIEYEDEETDIKKYKAIISIDFGSSYSGFAIAFGENSIESKLENIEPTTIVILKSNLKGYKFGKEAENFMKEQRTDEYIYFDRIKTKLDPKFKNDVQSKIYIDSKFPSNYKINLRLIVKEYLRLFSDNALKYYNNKGDTDCSKKDIKWIVTVPAIWNEYGKQFMRQCAKKAGMNKVIIALEPEAASLTMFKDDNVDQKFKEKGKVFMLIDAGGYTLDITINEFADFDGNLKQLSPPSGGAYGSMKINDYIIELVEETFTKEKIDELRKKRFDLWKMTLESIEEKKKELRDDGSDAVDYKISIYLGDICEPGYFSWIFGKNRCSKKISYGTIEYNNKFLYISRDIMKQILLKNVSKIIKHIKKLVEEFPKIDLFVLTGGFAKCVLLKDEIRRNFNYPYKELIDPEISVMRGAALYGIKPSKIISRKSPYTIGTSKYTKQKIGKECRERKLDKCKYFDTFIKKGEDIANNEAIYHTYVPIFDDQSSAYFPLYFSKSENQIYIDDEAKIISEFSMKINEFNIPRYQRRFELRMEFGSCITVSGKNLVTGEKLKIFANYYNRND